MQQTTESSLQRPPTKNNSILMLLSLGGKDWKKNTEGLLDKPSNYCPILSVRVKLFTNVELYLSVESGSGWACGVC